MAFEVRREGRRREVWTVGEGEPWWSWWTRREAEGEEGWTPPCDRAPACR